MGAYRQSLRRPDKAFMHFHFNFTTVEILWTLTFAAQLVLLVVLLGRDRVQRFPWFTASIVLVGLRLLTQKMLYSRLSTVAYDATLISLIDLGVLIGLTVLVELARRAFGSLPRRIWAAWAVALLAVGAAVLRYWGTWPAWKTLTADPSLAALRVMQLCGQRGTLLLDVLTVELGIVLVLLGRRHGAGWRSHTQQLAIGLSTASLGQLAVQAILQAVFAKAVPRSQADVDRILGLRDKIYNADNVLYLLVIAWWIACLWIDEPDAAAVDPALAPDEPIELHADDQGLETEDDEPVDDLRPIESADVEKEKDR